MVREFCQLLASELGKQLGRSFKCNLIRGESLPISDKVSPKTKAR